MNKANSLINKCFLAGDKFMHFSFYAKIKHLKLLVIQNIVVMKED